MSSHILSNITVDWNLFLHAGGNIYLIDLLFTIHVPLKSFSLIWRRHHYRLRAENLGLHLWSALRAFEQGWIFIVTHLLWHGASVFQSHPKDHPIQLPLTIHIGTWKIYSNLNPNGSPFSRLLRQSRGCWGPILTQILMGHIHVYLISWYHVIVYVVITRTSILY
jgi:hypothetical protein